MKYRPHWFDIHSFAIILMMAFVSYSSQTTAQCNLGCHPGPLTIALGESGETVLEPSYFLAFRSSGCLGRDTVEILGLSSHIVDCSMIGGSYTVRVTNLASGNYCETDIEVVDRLEPELIIPEDITIHCDQAYGDTTLTGSAWVSDNCSYNLQYSDNDGSLNECGLGTVIRTWRSTDSGNNVVQDDQRITIVDTIPPVVSFPADVTLHCDQDEKDLSLTGIPQYSDNCGNLDESFTDLPFDLCSPGTKRILRNWVVADFCDLNGENGLIEHVQTITLRDTIAPSFNCRLSDTLGTDPTLNSHLFSINGLNNVLDNCSGFSIDTLVTTSTGDTLDINSGRSRLPLGDNYIQYFVEDDCGNRDSCGYEIRIIDTEDPMIICIPSTNISISTNTAFLFPETFYVDISDNSSADEDLEVLIIYQGVEYDSLPIDCSWAGDDLHDILVRVIDESGNFNQCQSSFYVHDIAAPQIDCPVDITVQCGDDYSDSGDPSYYENCSYSYWYVDDLSDLNSCGLGEVVRKWIIEDGEGLRDSCYQYIEVINDLIPSFTGPADVTINCGEDEHPRNTGEPDVMDNCSQLIWAFTDQEISAPPGMVKVIRRTFEIIDNCSNSYQEFYVQDIFVADVSQPELECQFDPVYYLPHGECEMTVEIITNISDDCNLGIHLSHDAGRGSFNNQVYSAIFEKGQYLFNIYADDGLGNFDTAQIFFNVVDTFPPMSICRRGLAMTLTADRTITPDPALFDLGSNDNCTSVDDLIFEISPSSFNCFDQGENDVIFSVIDESGNRSVCNTNLFIQDPNENCPPLEHDIRGQILDGDFRPVYGMEVLAVVGPDTLRTESDEYGWYQFDGITTGSNVEVFPYNLGEIHDGLSTMDLILLRSHLLERTTLQSPYEYMAGDVNQSAKLSNLDISLIRGVILQNLDQWPGGENYGSIPFSLEFSDPEEILDITRDEKRIEILELSEDVGNADFIVVKTGDINNSAFEDGMHSREGCDSLFFFRTEERMVNSEEELVLQLVCGTDFDLLGMQFILDVDASFLEYVELRDVAGIGLQDQTHYNYNMQNDQFILTWDRSPAEFVEENSVILEIAFRARASFEWPDHIGISETEIVDENFSAFDICTSDITSSVDFLPHFAGIDFYPNPIRDELHLSFESDYFFSTFEEIIISDIFGRIAARKKMESIHNQTVSLLDLPSGCYSILLKNGDGGVLRVGKILKI